VKTLKEFEYLIPQTIAEVASLLGTHQTEAKLLAGGTDLVPLMKDRIITPKCIVDIKKISSLNFIKWDEQEGLRIGSLTPIAAILESDMVKEKCFSLHQAAKSFATTQVRNMATIGGNICRSSPSADTVPPLLSLDAEVTLVGPGGGRTLPLADFFIGPGQNVLDNEILTEIKIAPEKRPSGTAFKKIARTAEDLAKVNCAVKTVISDGKCEDIRIVLGAVAPTPIRAKNVEQALRGKKIDAQTMEDATQRVEEDISPIADCRSNAGYRVHASRVLIKRLINESITRAGGR